MDMDRELLRRFRRLAAALELDIPELDDLEKLEELRHKERLNQDQVEELIDLLKQYKNIICQI